MNRHIAHVASTTPPLSFLVVPLVVVVVVAVVVAIVVVAVAMDDVAVDADADIAERRGRSAREEENYEEEGR